MLGLAALLAVAACGVCLMSMMTSRQGAVGTVRHDLNTVFRCPVPGIMSRRQSAMWL